jgi:MFS family permease
MATDGAEMTGLVFLAIVTACGAAVRSTWSPCGLSMLSTITPLTERARGHRFSATVAWFLVGAIAGGATLGAVAATLALLVHLLAMPTTAALGVACALAVAGLAADLRVGGLRLPTHPRQVDETWLGRYRRWVYAGGFGAQIGSGLATYVMTAAVYLAIAMAALTGAPVAALGVGVIFGGVRGLAVLAGAAATSPSATRALHARLHRWEPVSRQFAAALQASVAALAAGWASGSALVAAAVAVGCGAMALAAVRSSRRTTSPAAARSGQPYALPAD